MKKLIKIVTMSMTALAVSFGSLTAVGMVGGNVALAADCKRADATVVDGSKVIDIGTVEECSGVKDINDRIYGVAMVLAGIVLGFAVLMIVYAGFKYATSQGDPKVTEQAKMQIISAAIGIGIAMLAFVIVNVFKNIMGN